MTEDDMIQPSDYDSDDDLEALNQAREAYEAMPETSVAEPVYRPIFQTLFEQSVPLDDKVLMDFARYVVGPLSEQFALKAAKGGEFFRKRLKEYEALQKGRDPYDYGRDQTLRAHLINGMLPARHIARCLKAWNAQPMRHWNETVERLFIAGYMLHDYLKIPDAQRRLKDAGFETYFAMSAPNERQIPALEIIFSEWCRILGLDEFLKPVGGADSLLHDLIYVACNTQRFSGTAHAPSLLPGTLLDASAYMLAADVSRLADLLAYVAPSPRELVAHSAIQETLVKLGFTPSLPSKMTAKLVYHHVAENRGVVLNFIHNAVTKELANDTRVPLLYAPSGVVYLQRHDAADMPSLAELIAQIVSDIRQTARKRLVETGKLAKRGNTGFQADDSYNDFFSLRDVVLASPFLIQRHIRNNKSPDRLDKLQSEGWADADTMPNIPTDARADKIAEWAGFIENQYRDRLNEPNIAPALLEALDITDTTEMFYDVRNRVKDSGKSGGIQLWWFWAAAHALHRKPGMDDFAVLEWLHQIAQSLAEVLPEDLPEKARMNEAAWEDLADYVGRVLTLGGIRTNTQVAAGELNRYSRAKSGRGGAICALCGSEYVTRKPAETAVSFQPGVYTARLRVGASDNKRNLCSICALEQLLRQLFVDNLDTGSAAESQRIRYLSFYPSYFFTPETLEFVKRAYQRIKSVRISDKDLWSELRNVEDLADATFWQGLESFLLRPEGVPDEAKFQRVVRYSQAAQATFLTVGFRNIDPTETESWVLPAWLALVFSVCLDMKVVVSDSSVPLIVESSELPETIWFDGAHAAVQALVGEGRTNIDGVGKALARLTAAYLIHLDTERDKPGKGKGEEHWNRFSPIAHSLMESPLHVFSYLKHQERDERPVNYAKIVRYIGYANLFNDQGDKLMAHAEKLVEIYRRFYRAKRWKNSNSVLRPLSVITDAILSLAKQPGLLQQDDELFIAVRAALFKFMDRVSKGQADGYLPKGSIPGEREAAMDEFCHYFIQHIFIERFNRNAGVLNTREFNSIRDGCDYMYRKIQQEEFNLKGKDPEIDETDDNENTEA